MAMVCPEIDLARSDARNTAMAAMSAGSTKRLTAWMLRASAVTSWRVRPLVSARPWRTRRIRSLDRSGVDDVGTDVVAAQLERQSLGEADQAPLGGGVRAAVGVAEPSAEGGHDEDHARRGLLQVWDGRRVTLNVLVRLTASTCSHWSGRHAPPGWSARRYRRC